MIKPWIFEFLYALTGHTAEATQQDPTVVYDKGIALWKRLDELDFEGIFFSEHHFGLSYSPSPHLLIAAIARSTKRLRLGTMGVVLPLYQPWRVLEEIGMLDHMTGGRLEIGCASGVPQELIQTGIGPEENRERFNETLEILDAWLAAPVISHHGRYYNFENLRVMPRPLQQPSPPKWTTVVSTASAAKSANRQSKICTAFESVARIKEIFDAYRSEADRLGIARTVEVLRDDFLAFLGIEIFQIGLADLLGVVALDHCVDHRDRHVPRPLGRLNGRIFHSFVLVTGPGNLALIGTAGSDSIVHG